MKVAVSSDEKSTLTEALLRELETRGHVALRFGALAESAQSAESAESDWPVASAAAARAVADGVAEQGIVCCWTGTGASIAANKVAGVRAALCHDAETARGARTWNDANVLALSLRLTTEGLAREILDAWFATGPAQDDWNQRQLGRVRKLDGGLAGVPPRR